MTNNFVHLHVHSEYSLLDGMSKIGRLFKHVKESDMDSVALTDHGVMYGSIEFYKKSKDAGVKPIIGMEAYTTNINLDKKPERGKFKNFHLLLLAKNNKGYKNLMKLTSIAHTKGYYYRPRITREILKEYSEGLICTSACPAGEIAQAFMDDNYKEARGIAQWFLDVFENDYYLEVQRHDYHEHLKNATHQDIKIDLQKMVEAEKSINDGVLKLSRDMAIPIVATNDAHYIKKEDATAQDALVCIATGKDVSDIKRLRFIDTPEYYIKTPKQMSDLFHDLPESIENTLKVADKCKVEITLGKWYFPKIDLPKGKSAEEFLREEANIGMKEKYPKVTAGLQKRLDYELSVINKKGYPEYFLIFKDMADWALENRIPINTRGSAAGSLVSYCIGVTSVDPIKYLLPFERFLNPFRPSAPDIDLDISDTKREDMITYLTQKYGKDKVAQICTFGRMLAKASTRDVARVLGFPYEIGDRISKLVPLGSQGFPMTIDKALEESPDLKSLYDSDNDARKIIDLAKEIEGNARHISVHAAGVVISPTKMTDFSPVQKEPSGEKIITQYEMHACEDIGLIKLDVLGIRNLAILEEAVAWVSRTRNMEIDISSIPLDDKKTFEMLTQGRTFGVFQMGGSGMTRYIVELAPERIEDIMAMIALFRPGPMANIPEYIARKKGEQEVKYYHPKMEKYLKQSFGILVYQDDLLYTALEVAGYDWVEVDNFRKAVGKKIPEEMAKQHVIFVEGCQKHSKMTEEEAEGLWKLFEPFQGYGFNKAHAASYGFVSYQTAYMKANYPVEYMCALLTAESNDSDKVSTGISECKKMNIKILSPDINESGVNFNVVGDEDSLGGCAIRFGLGAIKNVGKVAIEAIIEEREKSEFNSFVEFLSRVDNRKVNKKVLESLIKVGAMSRFGTRASLVDNLEEIRNKVKKPQDNGNQQDLFTTDEVDTSAETHNLSINLQGEEYPEEKLEELERELLGFALSSKPIDEVLGPMVLSATHKVTDITENNEGAIPKKVKIALVIGEVRVIVTKKSGQEMAFVQAYDETGSIDLVVFPKLYKDSRLTWVKAKPVLISGNSDTRDDSISILVEEVETAEENGREGKLLIKVPKGSTSDQMKALKKTLLEHPGKESAILVFEGNGKNIKLPFTITWDEVLARKISGIFS